MKILSFGEIIIDEYPDGWCLGGAPLNFAAHAVLSGAEGYLISAVGKDKYGELALDKIAGLGVDTRFISASDRLPTGRCIVRLDEGGVPKYDLLSCVAYDEIKCAKELSDMSFDAVAFGTLALRSEHNRAALCDILSQIPETCVYCDLNLRSPFYDRESVEFCLSRATVLKLSEDEVTECARLLLGIDADIHGSAVALAEHYSNLELIVITLGERGSLAYDTRSKEIYNCQAVPVKVVSTVGAGDSFGAAFLVAYLNSEPIGECLIHGAKRSAAVVAQQGAIL